jgi:hypothetical protein
MNIRNLVALSIATLTFTPLQAQFEDAFRMAEIRTDSMMYSTVRHMINKEDQRCLYFGYTQENEVVEVAFYPIQENQRISLVRSGDYEMVDSMVFYNGAWRSKIRFHNLSRSRFLKLFVKASGTQEKTGVLFLQPSTRTTLTLKPANDELFIGEEKTFDVVTNRPENLILPEDWSASQAIDYRFEYVNGQVRLHLLPNQQGLQTLSLMVPADKPFIDAASGKILSQQVPLTYTFSVKSGRLKYLNIDKRDITFDENTKRQGTEVQIDNARPLELNRTYRMEDQENPGGALIAELFTRSFLSNNRVLCLVRTYNYHRTTDGYLYIKNGDEPLFLTNFNITPATTVSRITVLRGGGEWTPELSVYPGETILVKIEGQALNKARFHFEEVNDLTTDTLIQNENEVNLKLQVPISISKKRVQLYNNGNPTNFALNVREYEVPRPFDYIFVNYGDINRQLSDLRGPILFDRTIRDVVISFYPNRIDSDNKLFGRQYLTLDVRVTSPDNTLIDMRTISNIVVCPDDNSPRAKFYDKRNCSPGEISLNKYLRRSTNDLDDWSRIYLSLKTNPDKYGGEGQQKELEIILKKKYKFDIDVSFPAGLVTVSKDTENPDKTSFSNLYGISMAMVAQFAFYHPEKIAKLRPFRVGAGFLALDAFNFGSDRQDLALVALASLYPTTRDKKLAFPLYIGGGYQFKAQKWMMLIGPGISVKL